MGNFEIAVKKINWGKFVSKIIEFILIGILIYVIILPLKLGDKSGAATIIITLFLSSMYSIIGVLTKINKKLKKCNKCNCCNNNDDAVNS